MTRGWRYQVRVQGRVSKRWAHWFDEMDIDIQSGTTPEVTTLSGVVVDQAALLGILQRLYTLGLPVLLVRREGPGKPDSARIEG